MKMNRLALAAMLLAAAVSGSGCAAFGIGLGRPAPVRFAGGAPEFGEAGWRGAAGTGGKGEAAPLTAEEIDALGRLEASAEDLEGFRGGYGGYYYAPAYTSRAEDFIYGLLAVAATVGLIIFVANNADETYIHADGVDILVINP